MSIELLVATRHRRDMTEELLKATLNPNKQQQPSIRLIPCCLTKLRHDEADCYLIAPMWIRQSWFLSIMELTIDIPCLFPRGENLLQLPGTQNFHPLFYKIVLMACRPSGKPAKTETLQKGLPTSPWPLREYGTKKQYTNHVKKWFSVVVILIVTVRPLPVIFDDLLILFRIVSIVFGSFSSGLVFGHKDKDLRSNPGLPLTTLLAKKFSWCVRSTCTSTSVAGGARLRPTVAWKAHVNVGSFSFLRSNQILGWVGFLHFLRRDWKVLNTISWALPTSAPWFCFWQF